MCGLLLLLDCFGSEPMFSFAQSRLLVSVILSSSASASDSSSFFYSPCVGAYVCVRVFFHRFLWLIVVLTLLRRFNCVSFHVPHLHISRDLLRFCLGSVLASKS